MGVAWWVLDPLLNTCVYFLVFGVFLNRGVENFFPFLIIGLVAWRWFGTNVAQGGKSILRNVSFVRQVSFKKIVFPLSVIMTNTYQFCFSVGFLLVVLALYKLWPQEQYLALPVLLLVESLLILAIVLPLSAITPFFPDLGPITDHTLHIMFFLSAVMYPIEILPPQIQHLLYYNPMVVIIDGFRDVLMYHRWPNWTALGIVACCSLPGIYLGAYLIARFDRVYAKRIVV